MQAQAQSDRAWIVVSVPADGNQKEVAATLDAARGLIAEADAAGRRQAINHTNHRQHVRAGDIANHPHKDDAIRSA